MKLTVFLRKQTARVAECLSPFLAYCDLKVIDVDEFPELAAQQGIWVTPTVILDDGNKQRRFNYFDRRNLLSEVTRIYKEKRRSAQAPQPLILDAGSIAA